MAEIDSTQDASRKAFEECYKHLDLSLKRDAWGRIVYEHDAVSLAWDAWQHQAARIAELERREPCFVWTGTEVDDAMILIDRMDDSLEPERIAQLEKILPRLGARIAELEAQVKALQRDAMTKDAILFEMRKLLDERPAMNAGLTEAYQAWTGKVYALDWMNACDSAAHNIRAKGGE